MTSWPPPLAREAASFVDNALLVSVNGNKVADHGRGMTYDKTTVASFNNNFNNSTGVANINVASGNMNMQKTYYSGPLTNRYAGQRRISQPDGTTQVVLGCR